MELATFGSIMKCALERETAFQELLDKLRGEALAGAQGEALEPLIKDCKKSLKLLERTRRETIDELVLHPLEALEESAYRLETPEAADLPADEALQAVTGALDALARFYADAASKVAIDEAKRAFERLSRKKQTLKEELVKGPP